MRIEHKLIINKVGIGDIDIECTCGWIFQYRGTVGIWSTQDAIDAHKSHIVEGKKNPLQPVKVTGNASYV